MSLPQFFRLAGLTTLILGTSLIFFPNEILMFFDGQNIADFAHFIRFLGTALIGFSVLNWYGARLAHNTEAMLIAVTANFTSLALATAIDLLMLTSHTMNSRGLLILALHLSFALGFGYWISQIRKKIAAQKVRS